MLCKRRASTKECTFLSRVEGKVSRVEGKMWRVEDRMLRVESRMSRVEGKMSCLSKTVDSFIAFL